MQRESCSGSGFGLSQRIGGFRGSMISSENIRCGAQRQELLRGILQELINRKEAYFSTNRRSVVDFVLTNTGDGYHLNVVSTLSTPPAR